MIEMRSERIVFFVCALAVLIVIGILGLTYYDFSSDTDYSFENSTIEIPSGWENLGSPDKSFLQYGYNRTFILTIEIINKSTYHETIISPNDKIIQNYKIESRDITVEGVAVNQQKHIGFNTTNDFNTIRRFTELYLFQKNGKFYSVRFDFISKNGTNYSIINSSSALFNETLKSIIRTI